MPRWCLSFLGVLFLAAPAWAGGTVDRLVLRDGSVIEGQLLEPKDGRLWILAADGTMQSAPYEDIVRVERGEAVFEEPAAPAAPPTEAPASPPTASPPTAPPPPEPAAVASPPAPANLKVVALPAAPEAAGADETADAADDTATDDGAAPVVDEAEDKAALRRAEARRGLGFGVDIGTLLGGRLRLHVNGRALAFVDVRAGVAPLLNPYGVDGSFMVVPQLGFFGGRPVHLVVGTPVGVSDVTGEGYAGLLFAADFDPRGAFHIDAGATYGILGGELALGPVVDVGWVW